MCAPAVHRGQDTGFAAACDPIASTTLRLPAPVIGLTKTWSPGPNWMLFRIIKASFQCEKESCRPAAPRVATHNCSVFSSAASMQSSPSAIQHKIMDNAQAFSSSFRSRTFQCILQALSYTFPIASCIQSRTAQQKRLNLAGLHSVDLLIVSGCAKVLASHRRALNLQPT